MNYADGQYVILPYVFPIAKILKYPDLVVYVAVRSFNGDKGCFPTYETIAERAGCSRDYVIDAIKRLEAVKMLECKRAKGIKKPNRYKFTKYYRFERIPYKFFTLKSRLTINQMGILLCLRSVLLGGKQYSTVKILAEILGLTRKQLDGQLTALIKKGYVEQVRSSLGKRYELTDKFKWIYDYSKQKLGGIKVENRAPIIVG